MLTINVVRQIIFVIIHYYYICINKFLDQYVRCSVGKCYLCREIVKDMPYRIIVLDLAGTLTNSRKEITSHPRETLIRAQEQGVKVVLASGRPTPGVTPLAEELRLKDYGGYILSYNGGIIMNCQTEVLPDLNFIMIFVREKKHLMRLIIS